MNPVISLKKVSKWYGQVLGLSEADLEIQGGITGLLGPNGSGKSTLLQLLCGEIKPSYGEIRVLGEPVWNNEKLRPRMAFCPDKEGFYETLSGEEFLEILGQFQGLSFSESRDKTRELLELLDLEKVGRRKISTYSKGMRQRLKFAQALIGEAEVYLLDEPLQGTDPLGRSLLLKLIKGLAEKGATLLVSSHVLHEIEAVTDRIVALVQGRIIAQGQVEEIRALMSGVPRRVSIKVNRPRELAKILADQDSLQGLSFGSDGQTLEVTTFSAEKFLEGLPSFILDNNLEVQEIHSLDESLEEVFSLLTRRRNFPR